jgi:DNA (cytosine-5)-methyltransferase 1
MRVLSLFSGVGGFDLGLERAGMTTVAQCEWDAKCQLVLARHWPDVPRWGDVADVKGADLPDCDLVAFGSPCQDLSVAGKRAGMVDGTRSGLFYEAIRIIKELQHDGRGPAWAVWENVVGALSSNRGHDFAAVVDSLAEIGAVDVQWRVLDAQWHGVPQRRRRVFVVARFDPRAAGRPAVLPDGASVRRDPAPGSEAGQETAVPAANRVGGGGGPDDNAATDQLTFAPMNELTGTITTRWGGHYDSAQEVISGAVQPGVMVPEISGTVCAHWSKGVGNTQVDTGLAIPVNVDASQQEGSQRVVAPALTAYNLDSRSPQSEEQQRIVGAVHEAALAVRRLTPRECERLMGWPDDWTRYTADGIKVADSHRYRMCGNGVAAPVAEWVGRCIMEAERSTGHK